MINLKIQKLGKLFKNAIKYDIINFCFGRQTTEQLKKYVYLKNYYYYLGNKNDFYDPALAKICLSNT
jgi:hypothetical protein